MYAELVHGDIYAAGPTETARWSARGRATNRAAEEGARKILDTGLRLNEVLSLARSDVDLDNQLVTVRHGKGGKQSMVAGKRPEDSRKANISNRRRAPIW